MRAQREAEEQKIKEEAEAAKQEIEQQYKSTSNQLAQDGEMGDSDQADEMGFLQKKRFKLF